jgi:hypothetical protein
MVVAGLFDPDKANFGRGDTVFKKFRAWAFVSLLRLEPLMG